MTAPLVAHHVLEFKETFSGRAGYRRSVGPVVGRFLTSLRDGRLEGVRLADGRVLVPPTEYDPVTSEPVGDFVEVGPSGTVTSWSWVAEPRAGKHPLERPFAFALIRPDGADTAMLHVVDVPGPDAMSVGMRVAPRWRAERRGHVTDIEAWVPLTDGETPQPAPANTAEGEGADEPVTVMDAPIRLDYDINAGTATSAFLRGLAEGRILGQRAADADEVYVPPRGSDPKTGQPTEVEVEVGPAGTVTTYCIVNLKFTDLTPEVPYVCAQVLLDGADIAFFGLIADCSPTDVRMGMRVEAVWADELEPDMRSIKFFRPTGEPDRPFDEYKDYL